MTDCNVIADLIPLYIDNTCSKESSELIEEHIKTCEGCKKLLEDMRAEGIEPKEKAPKLESRKLFESVRKSLVIVILSLCIMVLSYCFNFFCAYFGNSWTLLFTSLFIASWITLTVNVKDIIPLIGVNLAFGLTIFLIDVYQFVRRFLLLSGIINANQYVKYFMNGPVPPMYYLISVPFHGASNFGHWNWVYVVSAIASAAVIIYSIISLRSWKKYRS